MLHDPTPGFLGHGSGWWAAHSIGLADSGEICGSESPIKRPTALHRYDHLLLLGHPSAQGAGKPSIISPSFLSHVFALPPFIQAVNELLFRR
ncbi:hypothetical protein EJV46_01025 [Roseococcus sp. SYP-B2431]|nr:hypothetical protein EJV46_01025 [Roseococcus sp. SYP-B2431]